jgi:hypothetical protein
MMFSQTGNGFNNAIPYGQLNPYAISSPYSAAPSGLAAGGKTLLIVSGIIAAGIFIGMALGLGLGIGAAGIVSSLQLINVTNTTSS